MSKQLTILCIPLPAMGHFNVSIAICEGLLKIGHRIVFCVERNWKGNFLKYGFEEELYDEREPLDEESAGQFWSDFFAKVSKYFQKDNEKIMAISYKVFVDAIMYSNESVKEIIERVKPDFIIHDHFVAYPCMVNSGIPYAVLWSANPTLPLNLPFLPALEEGDGNENKWITVTEITEKDFPDIWNDYSEWMLTQGAPQLDPFHFQYFTNSLHIAFYPKALFEKYANKVTLRDNWMLLEHAVRFTPSDFQLPENFIHKPGKLIYVSMGSMASGEIFLMKHLVNMLSKSEHKFVVSLGLNHDKYEIAENMWGACRVPQLDILNICDLFITHGGNNSFIESLYFGVPMIVMPLFGDQHENAQRVVEMKLGSKMNVFEVTQESLLKEIETHVNDAKLGERLESISKEIKKSNSSNEIVNKIAKLAEE